MRANLPRFDLSQSTEQVRASFRFDEVVTLRESYAVLDEATILPSSSRRRRSPPTRWSPSIGRWTRTA